ncbi:gtpase grn1 [Acrodontium crateriforme]|uniref:Gtpase grn1 n=1 Tax=Acrodontium crateriforme TaxID=150365 RepID=A0AAQ3M0C6_9PEZI|nr:gtpase grn1 [Acrodontium crateriforme]
MKVGKPQSKRVSVRLRHKIQKSSAAKQRKNRKEAKKNPQWVSRLKKDPGIPNLFPFKAKVLAEIEEARRRKEEEQQNKREIAKAQRLGIAVPEAGVSAEVEDDEDEELMDHTGDVDDDDEMDDDDSNPMAALLASAQARAQTYSKDDENEDDENETDKKKNAKQSKSAVTIKEPIKRVLPKQALEDPVKAVSALLVRMQTTQDGIQRMIDYYQVPALVTSGTDFNSRFLVEVARKRGRLGKGGVPNLHAAALTVLGDLNEERLLLPTPQIKKTSSAAGKGEVQIVSTMAQPFRLEGLWADDGKLRGDGAMAMES